MVAYVFEPFFVIHAVFQDYSLILNSWVGRLHLINLEELKPHLASTTSTVDINFFYLSYIENLQISVEEAGIDGNVKNVV